MDEASGYRVDLDGESTGPEGQYLVWHYDGYGRLCIEEDESLEDALRTARRWDGSDCGSFDCIEGPVGVVPDGDVQAWICVRERAAAAARTAAVESAGPRTLFEVLLRHPDGSRSARWGTGLSSEEKARERAAEANAPGRVKITAAEWHASVAGAYHPGSERVVMDYGQEEQ